MKVVFFLVLILSTLSFAQIDTSYVRTDSCFIEAANLPSDDYAGMCLPAYWGVHSNCPIKDYHLMVFNRWGEIMFESITQGEKWYTGDSSDGVYVWRLTGIDVNGNNLKLQGHITVLK
ncbi:MAG: gliding motility-associated C-terminal domain-containing protein [Crocinitomicaceae bacterium]|nr:gliding motility-associated C-terminal domain-containing protein [Crocinitomicaceae bacterium]